VFEKFWFWTFTYASAYASEVPLSQAPKIFLMTFVPLLRQNAALWILAAAGLARAWYSKAFWPSAAFATTLLVFSFLAVCPGFFFRGHYFVMLLPAVALLAGAAIRERWSYAVFAAALLLSLFTQRELLFHASPLEASRRIYGANPFPEAVKVADYIRVHSGKDTRIAVMGSEPEIYFYSGRHSATSYIYMYGLMESQPYALTMQEDMIREVKAAAPEYMVEVGVPTSWLRQRDSPIRIFEWWGDYRRENYRLVGVADMVSSTRTDYRWDAEVYPPRSNFYVAVYRRVDASSGAPDQRK
jgi:hypothetical protein